MNQKKAKLIRKEMKKAGLDPKENRSIYQEIKRKYKNEKTN